MEGTPKVCVFMREYPKVDDRNFWVDADKWAPLQDFLKENKGKAEIVAVACPEVLGDTYRELVVNLAAIAKAGFVVAFAELEERKEAIETRTVEFKANGALPPVKKPILERTPAPEAPKAEANFKRWAGIICPGRKPTISLLSTAPEETYAQAQLLLMLDREMFRPSSQGREIMGIYDVNAATMEEFLQDYIERPEDLKLLEKNRKDILENGWESFCVAPKTAPEKNPAVAPGVYHCLITKDQIPSEEGPATLLKIKSLKEMIAKEKSFQCMHCLQTIPADKLERLGILSVSGIFSGFNRDKAFVYPICRKCLALPEGEMFSKVEKNLVEKTDILVAKIEASMREVVKQDVLKREKKA